MAEDERTVTFDFSEGQLYRVVPADGVFGGPTPAGKLFMAFYIEHPTVPHVVEYAIQEDGQLGAERERIGGGTITRRAEVAVMMDREAAARFHAWLGRQLELLGAGPDTTH